MNGRAAVLLLAVIVVLAIAVDPAFASDPFAAADDRAGTVLNFLTGKIATTVLAIVLSIVGFTMMKGWIAPSLGISIMSGGILIGSAAHVAKWIISG